MSDEVVEAEVVDPLTPEDFEEVDPGQLLPMNPQNAPSRRSTVPQMNAKERRRRALTLKMSGASYAEIANQLGYASAATAGQAVREEIKNLTTDSASELRTMQYERLNMMLLVIQPQVMQGDTRAIGTALSIMDRMNALMGVQQAEGATTNNTLVIIEGDSDEYIRRLQVMAAQRSPDELSPMDVSDSMDTVPAEQGDHDGEIIEVKEVNQEGA